MKAVIMAGGFGTRIQPLTNSRPKPMLPVVNKPMMQNMIEKVRDIGITDIVILLYFKPEIIQSQFGDGKELGVSISYVLPDDDYGTAGAVKKAQQYLDEPFFIVSGDLVTDFDFQIIADYHKEKNSKLTITLTSVENPLQFGVVITDVQGKIQKFLEKPSWGEVFSDTINTGIYILEPEILDYIPENENYDFGKQLFPRLMQEGVDLWGCNVKGHWRDVGNPESYRDAHKEILSGEVKLPFEGKAVKKPSGTIYHEKGTRIPKDLTVEGVVVLGKNVKIGPEVKLKNVVIGDDSEIDKKSEISDSVIWTNVMVGERCVLNNTVICDYNKLERKVIVKEGAIIAENCEIGKLVSFEKDVIVWPDKVIEDAAVISNNIIWGNKYKSSIFEGGRVVGRTNVELSCEMSTKLAEAFGSLLPVGGKVCVSRDYHKSSRMIKRAFVGGLLSTGINVYDVELLPSNVMRRKLADREEMLAGIHVRQSVTNSTNTEILFFTSEGLEIDTNTEKSCERIFFRESFRRVNHDEIGEITMIDSGFKEAYKAHFMEAIDLDVFRKHETKIVVDLLFGSTYDLYPDILNELRIENVILNAYVDDKKLNKIYNMTESFEGNVKKIVKSLEMDAGFLIYPNGQRLNMICNEGDAFEGHTALLMILMLLNGDKDKTYRVFLPAFSPDILDAKLDNVEIVRGKLSGSTASQLKQYDLVGNMGGNYAFTEFGLHNDALFASVKILEMVAKQGISLHTLGEKLPNFYYKIEKVACPTSLKGKMMRKFMEDSKGREASHIDGVKIWMDKNSWVLMIPPQMGEYVNLYIQSDKVKTGQAIRKEYIEKIQSWQKED